MSMSDKSLDMDNLTRDTVKGSEEEPEYCFWESELHLKVKSCRFFKDNRFKYLDHGFGFYAFFTWARRWINLVAKQYVEPYKFYPLPISDQILYWQPIFAKHVSDALVRLDTYETSKSKSMNKPEKPYKSIMMRAVFLTFWKRFLLILIGFTLLYSVNMLLILIIRKILILLSNEPHRVGYIFFLAFVLAFLQFLIAILLDHMNFYMYRLIHVIQYSFSITIFQHGLCHRRKFANDINGSNSLNVCNQVVHSCSPDSECSKNPLFCQALRYQNKDINSRIFSFEFMDSYYISLFIELFISICPSYAILYVLDNFVEKSFKENDIYNFKTAHMMSAMIVLLKITDSMLFVPDAMKFLTYSLISYFRVEYYMNECSPNFYISDNKYTGPVQTSSNIVPITTQLPNDVVVYYKDATFTWVNSRRDLLNKNYEPYLKNLNFELKRGEMAIVTGTQGSGKSNFIKSMLGEMTLVGGSMAVIPLHTSMPIFYASQDIWLQQGTIRSNITFGYKFDENLYNTVLKAVELEFDISTWDKGDLRVVSDNAHSLSGGQRVRMELARAVYAYLVFHKVNKEYNNSQCSFLMCLDASFHGLDPYVSKTIFNNLFNMKTGLLVKDDLSVVLTSIKRYLNLFSLNDQSCPMSLYHIIDKTLKKVGDAHPSEMTSNSPSYGVEAIATGEIMKLCGSEDNIRVGRVKAVIDKYEDSLIINPESKAVETFKYTLSGELGDKIMDIVVVTTDPKDYMTALIASLESLSRNNFVCQNAVSSSSTYRSFKREYTLLDNVIEYTDYCIRSWFYSKSFLSWASFISKFIFLAMTLSSFVIPLIYKEFVKIKSFIGFYGLNVMQNIRIMFTFTNLVVAIAKLEMLMCSIKRFECFIPPGQKCKFQKYRNVHKEDLVVNLESYKGPNITDKEVKKSIVSRRKKEFKEENKKFYCFRVMGFRPRVNIISDLQLTPEHTGVELKDVCVYTSLDHNPESMILKHLTVSAHKSEIIGMVGRTGAGKTTLLSVLQNIIENRTGQVLLDGKDLNDIPKVVLRQIIGVLPQLPFVFKGWTIRRFLDPRKLFSEADINDALDKCGLLNFVNELPGGKKLDSVIIADNLNLYMPSKKNLIQLNTENLRDYYEECDMLLSYTQLRTLSFARLVLYRNLFRIILVDEPPENLYEDEFEENDPEVKEGNVPIYQLLKMYFQHCTTFVTAHNSNSLRMCNSVWILHQGMFMGKCGIDEILKENSIANIIQKFVK
ncbi:hypothetical protein MACK_003935 [Theileria orientalis]|uniref:ABC transporter domain-containing protein n=1 Tax=Theileria orientalis TaxID=68886 RepID=A0A976SJA9_THEOR|nr:hypothetical protein MACK_003935 [Theileria orientalis]